VIHGSRTSHEPAIILDPRGLQPVAAVRRYRSLCVDRPLIDAVAANGGFRAAGAIEFRQALGFVRRWRSAAASPNENTPNCAPSIHAATGRDEVEFHPAYHELMAHSAHAGVHNSTWDAAGNRPAARPR
jgi:putative acyl-CoA dehydrogenase